MYRLNTDSVVIREEKGQHVAKLRSFSEASLVKQLDRLDFEKVE